MELHRRTMWWLGVLIVASVVTLIAPGVADAQRVSPLRPLRPPVPADAPLDDETGEPGDASPSDQQGQPDGATGPAPGIGEADESVEQPATTDGGELHEGVNYTQSEEATQGFLRHFLQMYDQHLGSPDWITRAMAVIGLAMIDDERTTNLLVGRMEEDSAPIVRLYAWEALHARQSRIDPQQRALWRKRAFEFAGKNLLRGDMRIGLVGLIREGGPTELNKKRIKHLFMDTNSINPSDIRTLWALGDTIEYWRSGDLVRWLIDQMQTLDHAYRAELVLRRLTDEVQYHNTLRMESSDTMWTTTRDRWLTWFAEQTFEERSPEDCEPYTGGGEIMPPGEKITDTADPKWRRLLELRRFHLDQLDVGLALDTTASMRRPLEWIKRDVVKMMRAFELISREPRIGITLYRDHGDAYVTRDIPLTHKAANLQKRLKGEGPKGGGDIPEALYEALVSMIKHQKWSSSKTAKKIIVVMTDAPPKEDSLEAIEKLVRKSTDYGFTVHAIKVRTSKWIERKLELPNYDTWLKTLDSLAEWGQGSSEWVEFWTQSQINPRWKGTARPTEGNMAERIIMRQVLQAALEFGYKDRVDPFIGVLLEYVEEPLPETRDPFPEATPHPAPPPRDPQMDR